MVRINIIPPILLSDQHLVAEYNETLMLMAYIKKFPKMDGSEPKNFTLGAGHMKFFRNKVKYLVERHMDISNEMIRRKFQPTKMIDYSDIPSELCNDWKPSKEDEAIIIARISERLEKKWEWYRYYGDKRVGRLLITTLKDYQKTGKVN